MEMYIKDMAQKLRNMEKLVVNLKNAVDFLCNKMIIEEDRKELFQIIYWLNETHENHWSKNWWD